MNKQCARQLYNEIIQQQREEWPANPFCSTTSKAVSKWKKPYPEVYTLIPTAQHFRKDKRKKLHQLWNCSNWEDGIWGCWSFLCWEHWSASRKRCILVFFLKSSQSYGRASFRCERPLYSIRKLDQKAWQGVLLWTCVNSRLFLCVKLNIILIPMSCKYKPEQKVIDKLLPSM